MSVPTPHHAQPPHRGVVMMMNSPMEFASSASHHIATAESQTAPMAPAATGLSPAIAPSGATAAPMVEDCRDYLRTGRCKYGSSCKYNHPANVQSGGGMRAPLNPGEPLFPIRPTEPICQYYLKHGTCKFGQACKFHHPPPLHQHHHPSHHSQSLSSSLHSWLSASGSGGTGIPLVMNLGNHHQHHPAAASELVCNPIIGTDPATGSMILQFLPQRPDEPDCIYFLKNGRCKYGATCRYHHPVVGAYSSGTARGGRIIVDDPPRRIPMAVSRGSPPDTNSYRVQAVPLYASAAAAASGGGGGGGDAHHHHQQQFLNFDGLTISTSPSNGALLQPVPVVTLDGTTSYAFPVSATPATTTSVAATTEPNSSASSLASSFETAGSATAPVGLEQYDNSGGSSNNSSSALLWNRARRNGSGGNLYNAGASTSSAAGNSGKPMSHSASDGNIVGHRNRSTSYGSTGDTVYYDASSGGATSTMSRSPSLGSWRNVNSSNEASGLGSLPRGRTIPAVQQYPSDRGGSGSSHGSRAFVIPQGARLRRSPRAGALGGGQRRETDEGFTMMTSALLNMLDAPEEVVAYQYGEEGESEGMGDDQLIYYESAYPSSASTYAPPYSHHGEASSVQQHPVGVDDSFDPEFFERLSISRANNSRASEPSLASSWASHGPPSRSGSAGSLNGGGPTRYHPAPYRRPPGHGEDDPLPVIHQYPPPPDSGSTSGGGDVGLFLP